MCTLTYIPIGINDFFFTTNRDENPGREAIFPEQYQMVNASAIFPKDKMAQGTWMMCHENRFSVCLLNGAFEKHEHKPPYRKSRGVMVLEIAEFTSALDFLSSYNFKGIEPFTLLVLDYNFGRKLEEIRWDGDSIHYRKLDSSKFYIWSSSTLYNADARKMRQSWFTTWLQKSEDFSREKILNFHKKTGIEDVFNGLVMNRKETVKTLSVTQIRREEKKVYMYYEDLIKKDFIDISFKEKSLC